MPSTAASGWRKPRIVRAGWRRAAAQATADPSSDVYASKLRARVVKDLYNGTIATAESINFVALSGGATTVAFNAANQLRDIGVLVTNMVTIAGWVQAPRPRNVGTWTAIVSEADFVASHDVPDRWIWVGSRPSHETYFAGAHWREVVQAAPTPLPCPGRFGWEVE